MSKRTYRAFHLGLPMFDTDSGSPTVVWNRVNTQLARAGRTPGAPTELKARGWEVRLIDSESELPKVDLNHTEDVIYREPVQHVKYRRESNRLDNWLWAGTFFLVLVIFVLLGLIFQGN